MSVYLFRKQYKLPYSSTKYASFSIKIEIQCVEKSNNTWCFCLMKSFQEESFFQVQQLQRVSTYSLKRKLLTAKLILLNLLCVILYIGSFMHVLKTISLLIVSIKICCTSLKFLKSLLITNTKSPSNIQHLTRYVAVFVDAEKKVHLLPNLSYAADIYMQFFSDLVNLVFRFV